MRTSWLRSVWLISLCLSLLFGATWSRSPAARAEEPDARTLPVASSYPAPNATEVRPDTAIEVAFDPTSPHYRQIEEALRERRLWLGLLADTGCQWYRTAQLQVDAASGRVVLRPAQPLDRYTEYAVLVRLGRPEGEGRDGDRVPRGDPARRLTVSGPDGQRWSLLAYVARPFRPRHPERVVGVLERRTDLGLELFGGLAVSVPPSARIEVPGHRHAGLSDLAPGDTVAAWVLPDGEATRVEQINPPHSYAFTFTTGSALHEPTRATLTVSSAQPSVLAGARLTLREADDYGLPAWGSRVTVVAQSASGSPLSPTWSDTAPTQTSSANGITAWTETDHQAQTVAVSVYLDGPYADGHDAHVFSFRLAFQPGPPASARLTAPTSSPSVATTLPLTGYLSDVYGNPVADGQEVALSASAGEVPPLATSQGGRVVVPYTAPTRAGPVVVSLQALGGPATASLPLTVLPGPAAFIRPFAAGQDLLQAGVDTTSLSGQVTDFYGNARAGDSVSLALTPPDGSLAADPVTTSADGAFQDRYTAGPTPGTVTVTARDGAATAQVALTLTDAAVGLTPAGLPAAVASLQPVALPWALAEGQTATLTVVARDAKGDVLQGVRIAAHATGGVLGSTAAVTGSSGSAAFPYTAPNLPGTLTVAFAAGTAQVAVPVTVRPSPDDVSALGDLTFSAPLSAAQGFAQIGQTYTLSATALTASGLPNPGAPLTVTLSAGGTSEKQTYALTADADGAFSLSFHPILPQASAQYDTGSLEISYGYDELQVARADGTVVYAVTFPVEVSSVVANACLFNWADGQSYVWRPLDAGVENGYGVCWPSGPNGPEWQVFVSGGLWYMWPVSG